MKWTFIFFKLSNIRQWRVKWLLDYLVPMPRFVLRHQHFIYQCSCTSSTNVTSTQKKSEFLNNVIKSLTLRIPWKGFRVSRSTDTTCWKLLISIIINSYLTDPFVIFQVWLLFSPRTLTYLEDNTLLDFQPMFYYVSHLIHTVNCTLFYNVLHNQLSSAFDLQQPI